LRQIQLALIKNVLPPKKMSEASIMQKKSLKFVSLFPESGQSGDPIPSFSAKHAPPLAGASSARSQQLNPPTEGKKIVPPIALPCANRSAASTIAPTSTMATRSAPLAPRSSFSALHVCHQPSLAVPPSTAPTGEDARHHPMAARPRLSTTVAGAGMPMEDELVVASPS
jgi:hypothetical protein